MYDSTFTPKVGASTFLVGTSAVQPDPPGIPPNAPAATSYRVKCLVAGYLTYAVPLAGNLTTIATTSVAAGSPATNTIGMAVGGVETFQFPQNCFLISSVAGGFEVTPGEGA